MTTNDASLENRSNAVQAGLIAAVSMLNKELDKWGLKFTGIVYDPAAPRHDGKLRLHTIQNVPDMQSDLLLEAFAFLRTNPDSYTIEEYHRIANHSTVQ